MFFCFQRLNVNKLTLYILRRKETCTSFSFCFLNTNWNIEEQNSVSRKEEKAWYTNERINPCSVSNVRFGCHYVTFCIKTKLVFFRLSKLCASKNKILCNRKFYCSCMKNNKTNWCSILINSKDSVIHFEYNLKNWSI